MYGDIKPDNILINLDTSGARVVGAKLADYGKSKQPIALIVFQYPSHRIYQVMHEMSVSRPILAVQLTL